MNNSEICRDTGERRRRIRERARAAGGDEPNGIDYVEVDEQQPIITVYFLNKAPRNVGPANVRITGGACVRDIGVTGVTLCVDTDLDRDDCMQIGVAARGDYSTYTLHLVEARAGRPTDTPLAGLDPRYARIAFSFRAGRTAELDCAPQTDCYEEPPPEPEISYLARDYASFRQLIFDRLSLVMPDWRERHVPDIGVTLVELLAYVGDYLSYYQDAVATEAYLDTARRRISVRRHAALVDYAMHEGCNARAWVCVEVGRDETLRPRDIYFITGRDARLGSGLVLTKDDLRRAPAGAYEVFETLTAPGPRPAVKLYVAHNSINFYTWHDRECCLPRGAASATLEDTWVEQEPPAQQYQQALPYPPAAQAQAEHAPAAGYGERRSPEERRGGPAGEQYAPHGEGIGPAEPPPAPRERRLRLKVGDVLIFEEVRGPETGAAADADPSHRHAVRLTRVEPRVDELYDQPVVEIEWAREDALPFPLCISSIGEAPECCYLENVSVARGNVILVDHGRTLPPESLPEPVRVEERAGCEAAFRPRETILRTARYRPTLLHGPLTHRAPFPTPAAISAAEAHFLGGVMGDVRRRVEELWARARGDELLSPEEAEELETIFDRKTLTRVGFKAGDAKKPPAPAEQSAALDQLLARFDEFLSRKARRVRVLRERVLSGYVLTRGERNEIGEAFGPRLAAGLTLLTGLMLGPASRAHRQQPREALPSVTLKERRPPRDTRKTPGGLADNFYPRWTPRRNLLGSTGLERHFVAEIDNDGRAHLRFGDGELGRAPEPGTRFSATYRVGNGTAGNVGPESISHVVYRGSGPRPDVRSVRNPLPAQGGVDPESIDEVKMYAPSGFRKELRRAITPEDYAGFAERARPDLVQRAVSELRWAGSWYEMQTAVDPLGAAEIGASHLEEITTSLHPYRRIGHDLATRAARFVPLDLALEVCVLPHYQRGHVRAALLDVFSNRALRHGRRGLFHPDNWSFGESVYLSRIVAAAQAVEGVESVRVTRLQRLWEKARRQVAPGVREEQPEETQEIRQGVLPIGPYEVARLDNDPNFPEHGQLVLDVRGGR